MAEGGPEGPGLGGGQPVGASGSTAAFSEGPGWGAGGGLLNTARFRWVPGEEGMPFVERIPFIREVLLDALGTTTGDLICAQRNGPLAYFEVTFSSAEVYQRVLERRDELKGHPVGRHFVVEPLWVEGRCLVTTHMFNPYVPTEQIRRFLQAYGEVHPGEKYVRDELGVWNGRRQFMVTFKTDGKGGLLHPPALFSLTKNNGYLFYRGQPSYCRGCQVHGHKMEDCPDLKCFKCLDPGHMARDCRGPQRCKQCRGEGHVERSCPQREISYATAVIEGRGKEAAAAPTGGTPAGPQPPREQEAAPAPSRGAPVGPQPPREQEDAAGPSGGAPAGPRPAKGRKKRRAKKTAVPGEEEQRVEGEVRIPPRTTHLLCAPPPQRERSRPTGQSGTAPPGTPKLKGQTGSTPTMEQQHTKERRASPPRVKAASSTPPSPPPRSGSPRSMLGKGTWEVGGTLGGELARTDDDGFPSPPSPPKKKKRTQVQRIALVDLVSEDSIYIDEEGAASSREEEDPGIHGRVSLGDELRGVPVPAPRCLTVGNVLNNLMLSDFAV